MIPTDQWVSFFQGKQVFGNHLCQQLVASRPWQEKLGFNVSKDRAAASRAVIYMLAGCKNVAGTAEIIEGQDLNSESTLQHLPTTQCILVLGPSD